MKFVSDPILGRGWGMSTCGRYRIARMNTHIGERFCAYAWTTAWAGLPELIDNFESLPEAVAACDLNERFSNFVRGGL